LGDLRGVGGVGDAAGPPDPGAVVAQQDRGQRGDQAAGAGFPAHVAGRRRIVDGRDGQPVGHDDEIRAFAAHGGHAFFVVFLAVAFLAVFLAVAFFAVVFFAVAFLAAFFVDLRVRLAVFGAVASRCSSWTFL